MLKSMRMGTKILASFLVAVLVTLTVGAVGYFTASAGSAGAGQAADHQGMLPTVVALLVGAALLIAVGIALSRAASGAVAALASEATRLRDAVAAGRLDVRGDLAALDPELRPILEGVNEALDAFARPYAVTADYVSRLSRGELPPPIADRHPGDFAGLEDSLNRCVTAVHELVEDSRRLSTAAQEGRFETRADAARHQGQFRRVIEGMNGTLDGAAQRLFWFEQILDAIPFPLSVTDAQMRWTFINAPVEKLLGVKRQEVVGKACENWNADICRTESCGIARLRKNQLTTMFKQQGYDFKVDTSYLKNVRGETVGHVEVVQEVTGMVRLSEYQRTELERLSRSLVQLSAGDLTVDAAVGEADVHTQGARELFLGAAQSLTRLREAVAALVLDADGLMQAAVAASSPPGPTPPGTREDSARSWTA